MSRKVRVGLVGLRFGEKVLLPVIRRNPSCEVLAVCGAHVKKTAQMARHYGIKKSYSDWRRLAKDPDLDAIVIATPPRLQVPLALLAIQNKKHVFCEKPLALSKTQAQALWANAQRFKVANVVDFEFPEITTFRKAKFLLENGLIGNIRHIAVCWNVETYANKMRIESWKTKTQEGGGALFSFVCHSFYYLEWFAGRIEKLGARLFHAKDLPGNTDTLANLFLEFKSGAAATISMSTHAVFGNGHRIEFYGEKGKMVLDNPTADYAKGFRLFLGTRKSAAMKEINCRDRNQNASMDGRIEPVARLFNRFVCWIETGGPTQPSFREGLRVQSLLAAAWKSHQRGLWVKCQ